MMLPRVREVRARTVQAEQVREVGHRDAEVRARLLAPALARADAAAADDLHRPEEAVRVEAGREDDHVDRVVDAVASDDAVARDLARCPR